MGAWGQVRHGKKFVVQLFRTLRSGSLVQLRSTIERRCKTLTVVVRSHQPILPEQLPPPIEHADTAPAPIRERRVGTAAEIVLGRRVVVPGGRHLRRWPFLSRQ